ncbi:DUF6599 family protein [Candidatus Poribacteria bacterium]
MPRTASVKYCCLLCLAVMVIVSGCGENEGNVKTLLTPVDLLPDDNDISGWVTLGAYDEANDNDGLYDIINGGAEIFIDEGFVSAVFQIYRGDMGIVHLNIYDQESEINALATYERVSIGIGMPWNGAGAEARIDESGLDSYKVEFWQENFYVEIIIEERTEEALNVAKLFASYVSGQIW